LSLPPKINPNLILVKRISYGQLSSGICSRYPSNTLFAVRTGSDRRQSKFQIYHTIFNLDKLTDVYWTVYKITLPPSRPCSGLLNSVDKGTSKTTVTIGKGTSEIARTGSVTVTFSRGTSQFIFRNTSRLPQLLKILKSSPFDNVPLDEALVLIWNYNIQNFQDHILI
jgi:hypothetical protein